MTLAADVTALKDRVLADLILAHQYYADTATAWKLLDEFIASGYKTSVRNLVTGTTTTEVDLSARATGYVKKQLAEATFQQFLAIFENFYLDLLSLWLAAYPRSLGRKMVDFKSILDLPDKAAIVQLVVRRELNETLYKSPTEWFTYLEEKANLGCPSAAEVERIVEAKAARDVLVHNRGIANPVYELKAGALARFHAGDEVEITEEYHRATWELIRQVVADVADAAIAKAS